MISLGNTRVPSEQAQVLQIFDSCEAFAKNGISVELVYPRRLPADPLQTVTDPFEYYQAERCFPLREIRCLLYTGDPIVATALASLGRSFMLELPSLSVRRPLS